MLGQPGFWKIAWGRRDTRRRHGDPSPEGRAPTPEETQGEWEKHRLLAWGLRREVGSVS